MFTTRGLITKSKRILAFYFYVLIYFINFKNNTRSL
jgi:hypothetical protein